ncbi:MAG: hypothetical protein WDN24_07465 [Sphingomonas sp.]
MGSICPAAHFQLGLDTLPQAGEFRVREDRVPWGTPIKRKSSEKDRPSEN